MIKTTVFVVFSLIVSLPVWAGPYRCDLTRCFSKVLTEDQQATVLSGDNVIVAERQTGTSYYANYIYKFIPNVSPEFALSVFTRFEDHKVTLNPPILDSKVRFAGNGQALVEYLLDTSKVLSGLGSMAPQSRYVVIEKISKTLDSGLVVWEIDAKETDALYAPKKGGLFGRIRDAVSLDNKGKPEFIHGYFWVESVPGGVVITYANYIVPESKMMSGTVNDQGREALEYIVNKTAASIESVASQGVETQKQYITKMCDRYFKP